MVTGVAGTQADTDRNQGRAGRVQEVPGHQGRRQVHRACGTRRPLSATPRQQLPSLPKIDGVWSSGGTDGILKAMLAAGRPLPTVVGGEGENGYRRSSSATTGRSSQYGLSLGQPPFNVVVALEVARAVLSKATRRPRGQSGCPFPQATEKTAKLGVNVFTNVPDSFFDAFTDSGPNAIVKICVQGALTGKAVPRDADGQRCPGTTNRPARSGRRRDRVAAQTRPRQRRAGRLERSRRSGISQVVRRRACAARTRRSPPTSARCTRSSARTAPARAR